MIGTRTLLTLSFLSLLIVTAPCPSADLPAFDRLAADFQGGIRPLLGRFCLNCHSTEDQEGDLDLERFESLEQVRRDPMVWQKVVEMLDNGEMPPKKKPLPTPEERKRIVDWARGYLDAEARAGAGDPGPVVIRRLSNVEYDNTVRDLTGVDLRPAREFPVDGAAGEGFTNAGEALAMSPALLDKYLGAAKGIAAHAVLLPDGFRFSEKATRRDWTDEIVTRIKRLYRLHTDPEGSSRVNLQGLVWDTNSGGRIPLEPYLAATLRYRDLPSGSNRTVAGFAAENGLSPKYLQTLLDLFRGGEPSPLIDRLRDRWRAATPADAPALAAEIRRWQSALTKYNSVGHFKPWIEPVNPLAESQEVRVKLPDTPDAGEIVLHLVTREAGDGPAGDDVEWKQPRLEMPGRAPILLRDLRDGLRALAALRSAAIKDASKALDAAEEARSLPAPLDVDAIASARNMDPRVLGAWFRYLGVVGRRPLTIDGLFIERMESGGGFAFVKGWGSPATPSVVANASDQEVHIPGTVRPHGVAVHPSPTKNVAVGWLSPMTGEARVEARVTHAHPACGNGVSWSLELRRGAERRRLSGGELGVGKGATIAPVERLRVEEGDVISLVIGPRGDNHACDLTAIDLDVRESGDDGRDWDLSRDVSADILAGNPHADRHGHPAVWHFYQEAITKDAGATFATIPAGSLLDRWRDEPLREERDRLAAKLQALLTAGEPPSKKDDPDAALYRQLTSRVGPLLGKVDFGRLAAESAAAVGAEAG